jgi:hypothetical protein
VGLKTIVSASWSSLSFAALRGSCSYEIAYNESGVGRIISAVSGVSDKDSFGERQVLGRDFWLFFESFWATKHDS